MKALIIRKPWIGMILSEIKTWEMRSSRCLIRGWIGLIEQGTGRVVGFANLVDSLAPLSRSTFAAARDRHRIPPELEDPVMRDGWIHPWVLSDARPLRRPVLAGQKPGQVIWVPLSADVAAAVGQQGGDTA